MVFHSPSLNGLAPLRFLPVAEWHGRPARGRRSAPPGRKLRRALLGALACAALVSASVSAADASAVATARAHGERVQEGLNRVNAYLHAWLAHAEPVTGLIPRNLTDSPYWNGKDSAADNYPFMVLGADFTDRGLLASRLRPMLEAERVLTARPGWLRLTDDYQLFPVRRLRHETANAERIFFNSAEYVKDGLLPLTEWLGPSPWSVRMFELVDDIFAKAAEPTPFGPIPLAGADKAAGVEINGDLLQALARLYWMSGRDEKYLRWGVRLADNYLLPEGGNHPTRDFRTLRLRDHGCEIVSGLCEFYATLHYAGQLPGGEPWAAKRAAYRPHVHEMLNRILEVGRNEHGLFYNDIDPQNGVPLDRRLSDGWGYVFDAYYTVYLVDGVEAYREAMVAPMAALDVHYRNFNWEPRSDLAAFPLGSQDGYADTIESALNLYNRFTGDPRVASVTAWMDAEILRLWAFQQPGGVIEGWHGDGNFARTTLMYCLWKTQGVTAHPWRGDLRLGAVYEGGELTLVVAADRPWTGTLVFDRPRHAENLRLPDDWPRINQFPEWFVVRAGEDFRVVSGGQSGIQKGETLRAGLPVTLAAGEERVLTVTAAGR